MKSLKEITISKKLGLVKTLTSENRVRENWNSKRRFSV